MNDTHPNVCHDGPLDGQTIVCRFPLGFLAVDRPAEKVWLYDRVDTGYRARESQGRLLDTFKRFHTALVSQEWDVIAVPDLGLTADIVDEDEDDGMPEEAS